MKKVGATILCLLIFLLNFSFYFAKSDLAFANDSVAFPSLEQTTNVNYVLPYPGLLPDSPLYFLRAIRDRVVGFLISDPLKKSEFDLLQADKRLNAGIYLFDKGKISLAQSTVSKAENYFEKAINKMEEAKKQGRDVGGVKGNLKTSSRKHKQELERMTQKAGANLKQSFATEQERVENFEERLND